MPARSAAQQKAAGAALPTRRGDTPRSELRGASLEMFETMTGQALEDLAHTPRHDLPEHADRD